ncbi:Mitosis inhibitor nif1 [Lecanosticta acicola]|uniref:Mitosis inhibitor nif1 n=1 Tax=Lecanosticta acicola TaxID=111012 RepID=A0AAI8Z824_9PEZI|nr:Mitosis inhibitor nif1 [Lecanosticta acicola]
MGPRPTHLNLAEGRKDEFDPPKMPFAHRDLPSPRAGEIPPALSPLDAFAMHSRMLARKFEEQGDNGRRMSRLSPVMVAKEIGNRPGYFRSLSTESKMDDLAEEETSPISQRNPNVSEASPSKERPLSHYPTLDRASMATEPDDMPAVPTPFFDAQERQPNARAKEAPVDYFGIAHRASSPEPIDSRFVNVQAPSPNDYPSLTNSIDSVATHRSHPRTMTNDSQRSYRSQNSDRGLAVPQSPRHPKSSRSFQSIRSVPPDSDHEDAQSANGSQVMSSSRKCSGSSASRPQSPFSPWMHSVHRSPSMTSEYSMNGSQQFPRATTNFSRPMSSSGSRPSFDTRPSFDSRSSQERQRLPHRQASGASSSSTGHSSRPAMSRQGSADDAPADFHDLVTPSQLSTEHLPDRAGTPNGISPGSYIYAKYALPRGRHMQGESQEFRDSWIQKQSEWDRNHNRQPSKQLHQQHHERTSSDMAPAQEARASPVPQDAGRSGRSLTPVANEARSRSADPRALDRTATALHRPTPSVRTDSTDRTIRATPLHKRAVSADLSAEEHLDIGIAAHDAGQTNKSTYHLRLASIAGLPTAMLLYALACRHGWGMRPNAEEGVKWLRKAIDTSGLDVADAEQKLNSGNHKIDPAERKKRKAQYALAIYELGVSSRNGWGCKKDPLLALRCYEIAGDMGDADALAEAGYCYAQGIGCKKDMKKAASLYRKAEERGMSMAGNSWIYKPKYMDDASSAPSEKDKKEKRPDTAVSRDSRKDGRPETRARSRSIFGRSKKEKPPAMPVS